MIKTVDYFKGLALRCSMPMGSFFRKYKSIFFFFFFAIYRCIRKIHTEIGT